MCVRVAAGFLQIVTTVPSAIEGIPGGLSIKSVSWNPSNWQPTFAETTGVRILGASKNRVVVADALTLAAVVLDEGGQATTFYANLAGLRLGVRPDSAIVTRRQDGYALLLTSGSRLFVARSLGNPDRKDLLWNVFQLKPDRPITSQNLRLALTLKENLGAADRLSFWVLDNNQLTSLNVPWDAAAQATPSPSLLPSLSPLPSSSAAALWSGSTFVTTYCARCHNPDLSSVPSFVDAAGKPDLRGLRDKKTSIRQRMTLPANALGAMPPAAPYPTASETRSFLEALDSL